LLTERHRNCFDERLAIPMMRLFCRRGYPLWLTAQWTGHDLVFVLFDGKEPPLRLHAGLTYCQQSQVVLIAAAVAGLTLPPRFKRNTLSARLLDEIHRQEVSLFRKRFRYHESAIALSRSAPVTAGAESLLRLSSESGR
jgi:hypothetical protein